MARPRLTAERLIDCSPPLAVHESIELCVLARGVDATSGCVLGLGVSDVEALGEPSNHEPGGGSFEAATACVDGDDVVQVDRGSRLLRGILDACLLALVAERDRYGYELADALRHAGVGIVRDGSIYPLLSRLQAKGYLESYIGSSASGPRRRYYRITDAGREELERAVAVWAQVSTGVTAVLRHGRST